MSSSGTLEEMMAKIIKPGALLVASNQISPWGGGRAGYGTETQAVLK